METIELPAKVPVASLKPADECGTSSERGADVEAGTVSVPNAGYARRLTKRQVMMITFGAGIGTGLWVGTGQALHDGK
jgi:yeast amino acid transporter